MIASSRIGSLHTLQLYEQFAHIGEPSDSRRRFVSAVTWLPHFAHLKQSTWKKDCLGNGIIEVSSRVHVGEHNGNLNAQEQRRI